MYLPAAVAGSTTPSWILIGNKSVICFESLFTTQLFWAREFEPDEQLTSLLGREVPFTSIYP